MARKILFQSFFTGTPLSVEWPNGVGAGIVDETKIDSERYLESLSLNTPVLANALRLTHFEKAPGGLLTMAGSVEGNYELFLVDPKGQQPEVRLTNNSGIWKASDRENVISPASYVETAPVMTPNGRHIVFCSNTRTGRNGYDIMRMRADGSELTNLTNSPQDQCWPTVSPDGKGHRVCRRECWET